MRFKPKKPYNKYEWNKWFAWYPINVKCDGVKVKVWLETIERKLTKDFILPNFISPNVLWLEHWEYRIKSIKETQDETD